MATLKDVAKETGLTVSTVSRVLNNRGYISEATRKNVYAAMTRLHYQPNEVARSLSKQASNTIGVIVPHIRHPYFAELISNLEHAASAQKLKIILLNARDQQERYSQCVELCTSNRVAGIILCSGIVQPEIFADSNIPVVTIERFLETGTACVECDNLGGGRMAAKELIDRGCRRVVHLSGVSEVAMPADERWHGFVEVCQQRGVSHHEVRTSTAQYQDLEYRELIARTLDEYPDTDGIFASSDVIASQVLQVCAARHIRVPEQMKVVGFDDVTVAQLTVPELTTIRQPVKEMAQTAVRLLIASVGGELVARRTVLPVSLIRRGTT